MKIKLYNIRLLVKFMPIFLYISLIGWTEPIFAQENEIIYPKVNIISNYVKVSDNISLEEKNKLVEVLTLKVKQLTWSSDFAAYDGSFSNEKYEMFYSLFTNDATVVNLLIPKTKESVEVNKYMSFIWDKIKPKSIEQKYIQANLLEISRNVSGDIVATISFDVQINSQYEQKKETLKYSLKPNTFALKGVMIIESGKEDDCKFYELRRSDGGGQGKTDKLSFVNMGLTYGIGRLSGGSGGGFENVNPVTNTIGAYLEFDKSIGSRQKWYLWSGLEYQSLNVKTDFSNKYKGYDGVANFKDVINYEYYDKNNHKFNTSNTTSNVTIDSLSNNSIEKIRMASIISGVLGIGRQMDLGSRGINKFIINIGVSPVYLFNVSKGHRTVFFDGYELPDNNNFPSYEEINEKKLGGQYRLDLIDNNNAPGNEKVIIAENNFSLSVVVAPSVRIHMGYSWGVDVGFVYSHGLGNLFNQIKSDKSFLSRGNAEENSIIQDFLPSSSHTQLQIKAGIYLKLK